MHFSVIVLIAARAATFTAPRRAHAPRGLARGHRQPRALARRFAGRYRRSGTGKTKAELEEEIALVCQENKELRWRLARLEAKVSGDDTPLWALEPWVDISQVGRPAILELGRDRMVGALEAFNRAHPKAPPLRVDGTADQLAGELLDILPALRQSAAAHHRDAVKRRTLAAARDNGFIVQDRIVEGSVVHVRAVGVQVELGTPFGPYQALLKPEKVTGVDEAPSLEFLAKTFPINGTVVAKVHEVSVGPKISHVLLSTRSLEATLGEMTTDAEGVYERARAVMAQQPPPRSRAERRRLQKERASAPGPYLEGLESFGTAAFEKARA
mmetsp:Transcript_17966/g.53437  ORF Transcript_17966/g.53437 Transcript_17966/m.53437 type:complete len:327 (-) Transcript_17966:25-1005(-)